MTSAQRLHGQDRASFGAQGPECGAQTVSAALPQKTHGDTPVLCVIMIYHSPTMTSAQRLHKTEPVLGHSGQMWGTNTALAPVLCVIMIYHSPTMTSAQRMHGQDRASFGAQWPQCGAQTVSAALPQKTHGETPVLCVIMIYHSPTMTSAQRLHGQDRASFGAQWPQCGAQTVSAALPQKTHGYCFVCNNDLPQSNHDFCTKAAWPRPSQFWGTVATMWGTNCECSIASRYKWCDPSFLCNNDLPQSNHDFCTKAAWPRPSQFWGTVATIWGTNSECSIAAKNKW